MQDQHSAINVAVIFVQEVMSYIFNRRMDGDVS